MVSLASGQSGGPRRRRRWLIEAGSAVLGAVLLIWSLLPVYNLFLIALDPEEGEVEFSGNIWPPEPSLDAFWVVLSQSDRYLAEWWQQFGNSLYIGFWTMLLTVLIASLASFAAGRMRLGNPCWLSAAALLTYAIPAALLAIPYHSAIVDYGLANSPWAAIAAYVALATPFAILILRQYGNSIPLDLDDAARIDGASALQLYLRIYLPLTMPALVVAGLFALVLAWNDYLYQVLLLSSPSKMTVALMQGHLFEDPDAAWNAMMAAAILYALPPVAIMLALRSYIARR